MKILLDCVRLIIPIPGLLFAFLLIMPLNERFYSLTPADETAYSVAFLCAGLSTIFLVAVGVQPILNFARKGGHVESERIVRQLARLALIGMVLLAVAFAAVVFMTADEVYHSTPVFVIAVALFVVAIVVTWVILPSRARPDTEDLQDPAS